MQKYLLKIKATSEDKFNDKKLTHLQDKNEIFSLPIHIHKYISNTIHTNGNQNA